MGVFKLYHWKRFLSTGTYKEIIPMQVVYAVSFQMKKKHHSATHYGMKGLPLE
jgi:hypothetical protein